MAIQSCDHCRPVVFPTEMPRPTRTIRPASTVDPPAHAADQPGAGTAVVALLARAVRPSEGLSRLHEQGIRVTGGVCSLLFQLIPRNGQLHPTSAFGLDVLGPEPWAPEDAEAALVADAFAAGSSVAIADLPQLMP